jgi:DNA polymerase elongation subunit (family B)/uracil-DNA glycosylase
MELNRGKLVEKAKNKMTTLNSKLAQHAATKTGTFLNGTTRNDGPIALAENIVNDPHSGYKCLLVKGSGLRRTKYMVVGGEPGKEDANLGRPFVFCAKKSDRDQTSGTLLRRFFSGDYKKNEQKNAKSKQKNKRSNIDMEMLSKPLEEYAYVTNVVKVRPYNVVSAPVGKNASEIHKQLKDRPPTPFEIAEYLPYLREEIRIVSPEIIFCFGSVAFTAVRNAACTGRFFNDVQYEDKPALIREHNRNGTLPIVKMLSPATFLSKDHQENLEIIKIDGVDNVIYVVGFPHPSFVMRQTSKDMKTISEKIHNIIVGKISDLRIGKLRVNLRPLVELVDIPEAQMKKIYEQSKLDEIDKQMRKVKLLEKYSEEQVQQEEPQISVSDINRQYNFSGFYKEETDEHNPWTDPKTVFYRRPDTESAEQILASEHYNVRLDKMEYDQELNMFELWGRSNHGDSVFIEVDLEQEEREMSYNTFRFTASSAVPKLMRDYLLDMSFSNKQKLIEATHSTFNCSNTTHQFLQEYYIELEQEQGGDDCTQGSCSIDSDEEMLDLNQFMEQISDEQRRNNDEFTTKKKQRYPLGYRVEFDITHPEALKVLDFWELFVFLTLYNDGKLKADERWKIRTEFTKMKSSRDLHTRYDDIPVWIQMRFWSFSLMKITKSLMKKMPLIREQAEEEPFVFAEFNIDAVTQFTLYTGIKAQTWFCLDPKRMKFKKIRGDALVYGWNPHENKSETSCDVHVVGSIDELFPSTPLSEWTHSGPTYSLSWDIEMDAPKLTFPDSVNASIISVAVDLQVFSPTTKKSPKGICRENEKFIFTLRRSAPPEIYHHGTEASAHIKYPVNVTQYLFKNEKDLLLALAYVFYQINPDVIVGHHNTEFDDVAKLKRSEIAGIIYGYNVPALGRTLSHRNEFKKHVLSSRAFQTQVMTVLTAKGLCTHDTRRIYFRNVKLPDFRLSTCAGKVLGDSKEEMPYNAIGGYHWGTAEQNALVNQYCLKDACLPHQLITQDDWYEKFRALAQVTGCVFPDDFTLRGAQVCCNGTILHQIFRPHGIDESNPRKLVRTHLIVDFKDTIMSVTTSLEELAEQEIEKIADTNNDTQYEQPQQTNEEDKELRIKIAQYRDILQNERKEDSYSFKEFNNPTDSINTLKTVRSVMKKRNEEIIKEAELAEQKEQQQEQEQEQLRQQQKQQTNEDRSAYVKPNVETEQIYRRKRKHVPIFNGKSNETEEQNEDNDPMEVNTEYICDSRIKIQKTSFKVDSSKVPDCDLTLVPPPNIDPVTGKPTYSNVRVQKGGKLQNFIQTINDEFSKLKGQAKKKHLQFLSKTFDGAVVFDVHKGFCNIAVITLDFSSLYPSIMIAMNYSTETLSSESELEGLLIDKEDFHKCIARGVPRNLLNNMDVMHNKCEKDKHSEQLYSVSQYYMLTVYEDQPDFGQYKADSLLRICKENVEKIKKMETKYFDGADYVEWFLRRYGINIEDIGDDFTLENLRTKKQNIVYLCTDDTMGQGLIPRTSVTLLKLRDIAKAMMAKFRGTAAEKYWDGQQLALKLIGNSIYGYTAAKGSNFFDQRISHNVTAQGQADIKKGVSTTETVFKDPEHPLNQGLSKDLIDMYTKLLGGDTDSCFFSYIFATNVEEAMEFGEWQANFFRKIKLYKKPMSFDFEKVYTYAAFWEKKRYAAAKSEPASNDNVFKKKRFIETNPELFPRCDWDKFFSMRCIETKLIPERDVENLEKIKNSPDFISCEIKSGHEKFYKLKIDEEYRRSTEEVSFEYKYYEVKKYGGIGWWKPGILVDAKGTRYEKSVWDKVLWEYTKKLFDMNDQEFADHFFKERYKSDKFCWSDHVKIHARGIALVRRDADKYLKETIDEVLKMIFFKADYVNAGVYIKNRSEDLLNGKVPFHQLIMTANYGKECYDNTPPHVAAIERVKENPNCGIKPPEIGDRFPFVIVKMHEEQTYKRAFHPEMVRQLNLAPDYNYYFKRFKKSLKKTVDLFFTETESLFFDEDSLSLQRTVIPVDKKHSYARGYIEVKNCLFCPMKVKDVLSPICNNCAYKILHSGQKSTEMKKLIKDLSEASEVYKQRMKTCFECTGTIESPCCTYDCPNYDPRMNSKKKTDDIYHSIEQIDQHISRLTCRDSFTNNPSKRPKCF